MRKPGRRVKPFTREQIDAIREYLDTDLTYNEAAARHDVSVNTLKYWVAKWRRMGK